MRFVSLLCVLFLTCGIALASDPVVVHEWGTFTSLQNERGDSLSGINQDVEPLPSFVTSLMVNENKGISRFVSPAVTMRLETPVVYFHLPKGSPPMTIESFSATFKGGLLSQWYPSAENSSSTMTILPLDGATALSSKINAQTVGSLTWKNFTIGKKSTLPATDSHVWLAPRNVDAEDVTVNDKSERYLFYRGVGVLDGPIIASRHGDELRIFSRAGYSFATPEQLRIDDIWYFDVRQDGSAAFRKLDSAGINKVQEPLATTPADFVESEYQSDAMLKMRAQMKESLIKAGLFSDEADAMLNTWEVAYFKSVGTRVFYIVPRAWTDNFLPIKLSVPAKIERVMIGRVDLVTPQQRELARAIIKVMGPDGIIPASLATRLGRFASAIVEDEKARQSAPTADAR